MPLKVLYIGHYKSLPDGYGESAKDYILALDKIGIDICCRPLKLNNKTGKVNPRILELEQKSAEDCNVIIQHTLPHLMSYQNHNNALNVALFQIETDNCLSNNWATYANMMDLSILSSKSGVEAASRSGIKNAVYLPHTTDYSKYLQSYEPIKEIRDNIGNDFVFYTIAEMNRRKNLSALLKAFHSEFENYEPVQLVIKTNKDPNNDIHTYCKEVKHGIKKYGHINYYKPEIVITDQLSEEGIYKLHNTGDCYVNTSFAEGFNIPCLDSLGFGKTPITTNGSAFKDYVTNDNGYLVNAVEDNAFGMIQSFQNMYTCNENWNVINVKELRKAMRSVYNNVEERKCKSLQGIENAAKFDYSIVAKQFEKILYEKKQQKDSS